MRSGLLAQFKYLQDQIFKTDNSTLNPRAADEVKNMMQNLEVHFAKKFEEKLCGAAASMFPQQDYTEERLKVFEIKVMALKAAVAPVRAPPGYWEPLLST